MKKLKIVLATVIAVGLAAIAFAAWYKAHYSMEVVQSFEVGSSDAAARVLIATQGSEFKKSIVNGVIERLQGQPTYVKVIDISGLQAANENEWNAVVVIHTWEMGKPPPDVAAYLERARESKKTIVLTTSGEGHAKTAGVDAITSASNVQAVPPTVAEVGARVDALLRRAARP